jgi:threonine synthase
MAAVLEGRDGRAYALDEPRWRGDDGSPLMVTPVTGFSRDRIDARIRSQWRYHAALPLELSAISLGEGCTPLLSLELDGLRLAVKAEWFNPTCSFKDRGVSVMIALLAAQQIRRILEDSSGNGGASVAAYAAAAGMDAAILAPEGTSAEKTLQARVHGAAVELVPGSRQDTAAEAVRRSDERFYASHNWHPFFLQGVKLLAYEVWEDLGFKAPDVVLVPAGAGSLVLGFWLGFSELLASGCITHLPRLVAVQPRNCRPLTVAFENGADDVAQAEWRPTIAEGTAISEPVRAREVLRAVRDTGGYLTSVEEDEIAAGVRTLAGHGFYVEPTSAQVVAALPGLVESGVLSSGDRIVVVLTGSGLKSATLIESRVLGPLVDASRTSSA